MQNFWKSQPSQLGEKGVGELRALLPVLLQGAEYGIESVDHLGCSPDWDNGDIPHRSEKPSANKTMVLATRAASTLETSAGTSLPHKKCTSHPTDLLGRGLAAEMLPG